MSENWGTPDSIKAYIKKYYKVSRFDPAPFNRKPNFDGLKVDWSKYKGVIFVNPPYAHLKEWCKKCYEEYQKGVYVILFMPNNRGHTDYYQKYVEPVARVENLPRRLKYKDLDNSAQKETIAPFGSVLVHYAPIKHI